MRWVLRLLAVAVLVCAPLAVISPARADLCEADSDEDGIRIVDCTAESPGTPGGGSGGGPSCAVLPGDNDCSGQTSCYTGGSRTDPEALSAAGLIGPRPGPDWYAVFSDCPGRLMWSWVQQSAPTPGQLAQQALGTLPFPQVSVGVSPPTLSLVNLDTWWWAQGVSTQVLSSSAGTVTVTATPRSLQVDAGDGSKITTCPVVVSESDACSTTYRRASPAEGYPVRVRVVWDLAFTDNGVPSTFPGLPTQFTGQ